MFWVLKRTVWLRQFFLVPIKYVLVEKLKEKNPFQTLVCSFLFCYNLLYICSFRRFVWNFFRLENEHLNNCGQFRAVRDISIAPLESNDLSQLIEMMDEDDGACKHRSDKGRTLGK